MAFANRLLSLRVNSKFLLRVEAGDRFHELDIGAVQISQRGVVDCLGAGPRILIEEITWQFFLQELLILLLLLSAHGCLDLEPSL